MISKNHPAADPWMTEEDVFGVVLSVQPESSITLLDNKGLPIVGKDGKQVRMPGIPNVEVAFPEDDYEGGFYLPADCLEVLKVSKDSNVPPENPANPPANPDPTRRVGLPQGGSGGLGKLTIDQFSIQLTLVSDYFLAFIFRRLWL